MKFLLTYQGDASKPPTPETMAAIGKFSREMMESGVIVMTGGLVRPNRRTQLAVDVTRHPSRFRVLVPAAPAP